MSKPIILTLLSPRYEFSYRMHDALLSHPTLSRDYELQVVPYSPGDEEMPDVSKHGAVGSITALNVESENMEHLVSTGARIVNISDSLYEGTSSLYISPEYLAEAIVRHAQSAGFKTLAYLATRGIVNQENGQGRLFEEYARKAGLNYWQESVEERPLEVSLEQWSAKHSVAIERLVNAKERTLVYTFHDGRALTMMEIFKDRGVKVPEEVGVLGRGNSLNARSGAIPISSFVIPMMAMAQKAVELIKSGEDRDIRVAHGDIVSRSSTVGIEKPRELTEKLPEMIQQYGIEGITVDELATLAGVSRSTLERNYREVHGEAPSVALKRVRMQRIEHLLTSTNLTIEAIAQMVGFASTRAFTTMFQNLHGVSPGKWRKL